MNEPAPHPPALFKDRKVGLVIFGVMEMIVGLLCALAVPLMVFTMLSLAQMPEEARQGTHAASIIPAVVIYLLGAVFFTWMGIGSILARRWARDLWLVSGWLVLVSGVFGLLFYFLFMPDMYQGMIDSGELPASMASLMKIMTAGFLLVFYVVLPGCLVLFYGSRHVKATCAARDPVVRWTERCPLPVLAVSLMLGGCGVGMLSMAGYNFAMPFFGVIVSGAAGAAVLAGLCAALLVLAWGTYRLAEWAWWGAVGVIVLAMISWVLTFSRVGLMAYYEAMNLPAASIEMMRSSGIAEGMNMAGYSAASMMLVLGYLLFIRKYFFPAEPSLPAHA